MRAAPAILFDLDELLADTQPIWHAAETKLFSSMGHRYDPEVAKDYKGLNAFSLAKTLYDRYRPEQPLAFYQTLMRNALIAEYATGRIAPMPGAIELVRRLRGLAPMAVASGSPVEGIERATAHMGIRDCFQIVVSSESVARGKPAPDVFLRAAELLGASPQRCLVFEDSLWGVRAALAAEMKVFAVPVANRQTVAQAATRTFASLADVTVADVRTALAIG